MALEVPGWPLDALLREQDARGARTALPGDAGPPPVAITATTRRRSSSRRAPRPSRRASSSRTATSSPTSCRSRARWRKYRGGHGPFFPIRFLNLLPLSHMFGQAMATFVPPMLRRHGRLHAGLNPHDIVRQIRARRISVLVCVPKMLDVLREYVRFLSGRCRAAGTRPDRAAPMGGSPVVAVPRVHRALRLEVLGFVVGAAPLDRRARGVLGAVSGTWSSRATG